MCCYCCLIAPTSHLALLALRDAGYVTRSRAGEGGKREELLHSTSLGSPFAHAIMKPLLKQVAMIEGRAVIATAVSALCEIELHVEVSISSDCYFPDIDTLRHGSSSQALECGGKEDGAARDEVGLTRALSQIEGCSRKY